MSKIRQWKGGGEGELLGGLAKRDKIFIARATMTSLKGRGSSCQSVDGGQPPEKEYWKEKRQ